jgi:hypothetical protein
MMRQIEHIRTRNLSPSEQQSEIRQLLVGTLLRNFSTKLDERGRRIDEQSQSQHARSSTKLLIRQYGVLYRQSVQSCPLPIYAYMALMLFGVFPSMLRYLTFDQTLFGLFTICIAIGIFGLVLQTFYRQTGSFPLRASFVIIYLMGLTPALAQYLGDLFFPKNRMDYPPTILLFSIPLIFYIMVRVAQILQPAVSDLVHEDQLVISSSLSRAINNVIESELVLTISHSWAVYVHGKVLTKLAAISIRLGRSASQSDQEMYDQTMIQLQELLNNPTMDMKTELRQCQDEVLFRISPWEGLVDISADIDPGIRSLISPRVTDLGEVLEEAISNSVRHGKSNQIKVKIEILNTGVCKLILEDDSQIPLPDFQARIGLGTKLFNLVSDGRWTIKHSEDGSTFTLLMEI